MPELPEVNTFQRYFYQHAVGKQITKVRVSDALIIRNLTPRKFSNRLEGRTFTGSYRRGKFLFGELDNGHHLLLHFGMTGDLKIYEPEAGEEAPRFERFHFEFEDGTRLGFDCARKFARIVYIEDLQDFIAEKKLGEDAQRITKAAFLEFAKGKKCTIKGFLLNQKYLAGMGNLYADAVCYDTRIHPASRIDHLSQKQLSLIFTHMQDMLKSAVEQYASYKEYPNDWFWDWRKEGNKPKKKYGLVQMMKVAGRSTYYLEGWQKLY